MTRFSPAVFLGSLLLFLVQPVLARTILPWYGGTPTVWTTCLLFFQVLLLGGYLYAHILGKYLTHRVQVVLHATFLTLSLGFLPITPDPMWKPAGPEHPVAGILLLLTLTVGLPYVMVSASSPLLQNWYHYTEVSGSPYRLFALSNLGSLLGLLAYPLVVEPWLSVSSQTRWWSAGYLLYVAWCAACAFAVFRRPRHASRRPQLFGGRAGPLPARPTNRADKILWLTLSACGSVLLLATTNQLCENVAVVPFLWVLPLTVYLLSFVLCFQYESAYQRPVWVPLFVAGLAAVPVLLELQDEVELPIQLLAYSVMLLASFVVLHGELVRIKPSPARLTSFYLMVAAGGATGGVFVGLVAPLLFQGYWEFPLGLVASYVLVAICMNRRAALPSSTRLQRLSRRLWVAGAWVLIWFLGHHVIETRANALVMVRNFYGVLKIYDGYAGTVNWNRYLWHGSISHGSQFLDETRRRTPTLYYGRESGVALAIEHHPRRAEGLRIGVVGLGAGTLACYGRENDVIRFYEINPAVVEMAKTYFYYLQESPARVDIVLGDARVALERELATERSRSFDVLVIDAFNSDAIPVHLLTIQAFQLYRRHLRSDGILAVHISNLYLDLKPLVRTAALDMEWPAVLIENAEDEDQDIFSSEWALLTTNRAFLAEQAVTQAMTSWGDDARQVKKEIRWTDDYTNLFSLLASES